MFAMFGLFGGNKGERIALFDVSSSSVRAAYALVVPGAPLRIIFETKVGIEAGPTTVGDAPMLRAMDAALRELREKGAPLLRKATGSGSASRAYASVCAPWQKTNLRTESRVEDKPFTVTEGFIREALGKEQPAKGHVLTEEAVVATLLNGYETHAPVGKKASHAEVIVLSASMGEETYSLMRRALASFSASREVRFSSFASVAFRALHQAFPHEGDYLALRVSGEATELAAVKRGFPLSTGAIGIGVNAFSRAARESGISSAVGADQGVIDREKSEKLDQGLKDAEAAWTAEITSTLQGFAAAHALPRTVFLLTDEEALGFFSRLLNSPDLHRLWLSDEPLSVIPLDSKHFASLVVRDAPFSENAPIDLLALHASAI